MFPGPTCSACASTGTAFTDVEFITADRPRQIWNLATTRDFRPNHILHLVTVGRANCSKWNGAYLAGDSALVGSHFSSRTQMLRKLMGELVSPCAWSLMGAVS